MQFPLTTVNEGLHPDLRLLI